LHVLKNMRCWINSMLNNSSSDGPRSLASINLMTNEAIDPNCVFKPGLKEVEYAILLGGQV
jgi:hypothetical protein